MKFKIGDKVRRITFNNNGKVNDKYWELNVGETATVVSIFNDWATLKSDKYPFDLPANCTDYLELVKDESGSRWARNTLIYKTVKAEMQGKPEWPALRKELIVMLNEAKEKFGLNSTDFKPESDRLSSVVLWFDTKQGFNFWHNWAYKLQCGWE
jgi:hypothetical protein